MLKSEIEVLAAVFLNMRTGKQLSTSRLTRYSPFVVLTLESLKKNSYIARHKTMGYVLTDKGLKTLADLSAEPDGLNSAVFARMLRTHAEKAGKAIRMIEQLGREYEDKINGS